MKILVISELYPPSQIGGYELQCYYQVQELLRRGHQVYVLTSDYGMPGVKDLDHVYRLLKFCRLEVYKNYHPSQQYDGLFWRFEQLKWANENRINARITSYYINLIKPDILYLWRMEYISLSPFRVVHNSSIPYAMFISDYWLIDTINYLFKNKSLLKTFYRRTLHNVISMGCVLVPNALIFSSDYIRKYYQENNIVSKISSVIRIGIQNNWLFDPVRDQKNLAQSTHLKLCYVGRLVPEKGVEICIKVIAQLLNRLPYVTLDIIGSGDPEYQNELIRTAESLGVGEKVRFVGKLTIDELRARYKEYDFLLCPSQWEEPIPTVILEGMASGVLVIASKVGGIPEIIQDMQNGILADAANPQTFTDGILKILSTPELSISMRQNAFRTVKESFTISRVVDEVEAFLMNQVLTSG